MAVKITETKKNTWVLDEGMVKMFLLAGEKEALLIDTGMMTPNAKEIAEGLTKLPIMLLNTHADPDHISGNAAFDQFYMHADEEDNYRAHGGKGTIIPVADGDLIDLGGRVLKIYHTPGHTPGSISILDEANKIFFGGDGIQDGNIYMFGPRRDMEQYLKTMENVKLLAEQNLFDEIYPSHGSLPVKTDIIDGLIAGAKSVLADGKQGNVIDVHGQAARLIHVGCAGFLCNV